MIIIVDINSSQAYISKHIRDNKGKSPENSQNRRIGGGKNAMRFRVGENVIMRN